MRIAATLSIAALIGSILVPPAPRLVWNVSNSAPTGLYRVDPGGEAQVGEMAIARVPERWRGWAATRHYIPINVPLVKRVAAAHGDFVCAKGSRMLVNGHEAAVRLSRDARGQPLPWWQGCRMLGDDELFLLMDGKASFDGRYFGVTHASDLVGPARLIWAS